MKEEKHSYIKGLLHGIGTLLTGMKVTGREFFTPKVTEQYPENRATLKISPRFRGRLIMPVDENGNNKCIACGLCVATCPEVFQFEDGLSSVIVDEIPEYCIDDAQEAEENCPVSVISVFE